MSTVTFREHGQEVSVEVPDERWVEACNMARARLFPDVPMVVFDAEAAARLEIARKAAA